VTNAKPRLLPSSEPEDLLFTTGDCASLLLCEEVQAICQDVKRALYFGQPKLAFKFTVVEPEKHAGEKLEMFVHNAKKWHGHPPRSSKLHKVAAIALGGPPRRQRLTKSVFVGKIFRCRLKSVGQGAAAYSVVENLLEKLTG